jgi:TP901 family phage tail tape measure protein
LKAVNYASSELEKVKEQTRGLREVGSQLQQTGLTMMGWGAAIAAPFGLALKQFMGFEEEMRNVNAVMQGTEEDFQALSKTVNDVAMNSSFMTSEIASAAYALASAGKKRVEIEAMIGPVSNLAEAMHSELRPTAELVTDTLDQFGLSAKETGRVVDIFATSVGSSPETLERLSYGMRYAGSTAAGFGYSLEETVAALMAFETAGIHGEQAGTTLRNALARLAAPTKDVVDALKMYGLTIEDVNPAQHSFVEILEAMRRAGVDTTGTYEIFGTEIGGRMAAAVSTGVEKIKDFTATLENSAGAAERMKEEQLSSLAGQFKLLKSSLESLGNSFAALFKDEVSKAINWIRNLANWLNNLDEGTKRLIVNVAKWGSILLIGAGAVNFLTGTVMKTIASFKSWGSIIGSVIKLITGKVAAAGAAGQALTTLSGTAVSTGTSLAGIGSSAAGVGAKLLAFATGPVGITIAAIAGITAGAIALYKVMDNLSKDWFKSDLEKALNQVRETADGTVETMEEVSRRFSNLSSQASDETKKLSGTISGTFSQLEDAVRGFDQINSTVAVKAAMNMQKIAEEAGYTGNAFRDLAKEFSGSLTLSSEEVISKLKKVMEEVDAVALDTEATNNRIVESIKTANEAMAQSTAESQSVLANLVSSYDKVTESIVEAANQQVKAIDMVSFQAVGSVEAFVTMMERQKKSANDASNEVGIALGRVVVAMAEQGKVAKDQVAGLKELYDAYDSLSEELEAVEKRYGTNSSQADSLRSSLNTLKGEIASLGWSAGESAVKFGDVKEILQQTATEVQKTGKHINEFLYGSENFAATKEEALQRVRTQFKATETDSLGLVNAFNKLTKPAKMFGNDVDVMGVALADLEIELYKSGVLTNNQTSWLISLSEQIASTREEYRKAISTYGENSREANALKTSLQELEVIYGRNGKSAAQAVFDSYGFGETLVFLRENLGLTSAAFAKLLGISDTNILAQDAKTINEQWKKVQEGSGFASDALKSIQNNRRRLPQS